MKKILDLRFTIGAFFTIIGTLLLIYRFFFENTLTSQTTVNLWGSLIFLIFGLFMIILSYSSKLVED